MKDKFLGLVFLGIIILTGTGLYFAYDSYAHPRIPDMSLPTTNGKQEKLLDFKGKKYGVIMYGSLTPCKGHISAMKKNAKSYDILMKSEKYHPILVYGDKDAAGALEFAKTLGKPVFLDPGRKLAKILGVKWYLVAVFDEKGKSRVFRHGIGLIPKKELPELLDKDVEK